MTCTPLSVEWTGNCIVIDKGKVTKPTWLVAISYNNFFAGSKLVNTQHFDLILRLNAGGKVFKLYEYHGLIHAFDSFTVRVHDADDVFEYLCRTKVRKGTLELLVSPDFFPCSGWSHQVNIGGEIYWVYEKSVDLYTVHCPATPAPTHNHNEVIEFRIDKIDIIKKGNNQAALRIHEFSTRQWPLMVLSGNTVCCAGVIKGSMSVLWWVQAGRVCVFPKHPDEHVIPSATGACKLYQAVSKYYSDEWINNKEWKFKG